MDTKTLAQLKRDMVKGARVELVAIRERAIIAGEWDNATGEYKRGEWQAQAIGERIKGARVVSYSDTTGFYLKHETDKEKGRGSFCEYPKASELEYQGDTFTITERTQSGEEYQKRTYRITR